MTEKIPITVVIPTLNEADRICECIESVCWAAEVIVVDGGSVDGTPEVAAKCGATVLSRSDATIGGQRNEGVKAASNGWVLALDADERVDASLRAEIAVAAKQNARQVYSIRRRNYFRGVEVRRGGWGSDWVVRLFPASEAFCEKRVHERVVSTLPVAFLRGHLVHNPYRDDEEFECKLERYAAWAAADIRDAGRRFLRLSSWLRPPLRFIRMLFVQLGILDGSSGVVLAWRAARSVRLKYRLAANPRWSNPRS